MYIFIPDMYQKNIYTINYEKLYLCFFLEKILFY